MKLTNKQAFQLLSVLQGTVRYMKLHNIDNYTMMTKQEMDELYQEIVNQQDGNVDEIKRTRYKAMQDDRED